MKKISFDFDDTLTKRSIKKLAAGLVQKGHDVWIVTSRKVHPTRNAIVFETAFKLGIPKEKIVFVGDWKVKYFVNNQDFDYHIDDYWVEIDSINSQTNVVAFPCDLALYFKEVDT